MKRIKSIVLIALAIICSFNIGLSQNKAKEIKKTLYPIVLISTNLGDIKIRLSEQTPLHSENFIKLIEQKYYDSLLFHRVINNFMIQGGDPQSKHAMPGKTLGEGGPAYTIPAEFVDTLIHKKGALAAARQGDDVNPMKASSGSQFYIVHGRVWSNQDLDKMELQQNKQIVFNELLAKPEWAAFKQKFIQFQQTGRQDSLQKLFTEIEPTLNSEMAKGKRFSYNDQQRKYYTTIGGTPHLDRNYTVFGEVIEGLDVIDKIAVLNCDGNNRPLQDVIMNVKLIKK